MSIGYKDTLVNEPMLYRHGRTQSIPHPSQWSKSPIKLLSLFPHWHAIRKAAEHLTKLKSYASFTHSVSRATCEPAGEERRRMKKWVMNIKCRRGGVMTSTPNVSTGFAVTAWVQGLSWVLNWLRRELSGSHFLWHANLPFTHSTNAYSYSNS